jgi:hypothetical protein
MNQKPSRTLLATMLAFFLAVILGIPMYQAAHEALVDHEMPHFLEVFTGAPTKAHLHGWDQSSRDRSVFSKMLRPAFQQWEYDLLGYTGPKAIAGKTDGKWLFYSPDVQYLLGPAWNDERFFHNSLDTMVAGRKVNVRSPLYAIQDFHDKLKQRGIELLLVPIPGKPSIYPELLDPSLAAPPASPTEALIAELRKRGIDVVDLFEPLRKAKSGAMAADAAPATQVASAGATPPALDSQPPQASGSGELYLRRDTHWTPRGLEIAAANVAENVRSRAWFRELTGKSDTARIVSVTSEARKYSLRPTEVERWGDIAEMTKLPKRKDIWPVEKVTADQVVDSAGTPYKDVDTSAILVLGDSFSRIYQTDAPKSAGFISHLAYDLGMPVASVVNDGGASTLVRRQLFRKSDLLKGKKLVVWEFVERDIRYGEDGWQLLDLP